MDQRQRPIKLVSMEVTEVTDFLVPLVLHHSRECDHVLACLTFARQFDTLADVWQACHRADWMLWVLVRAIDWPLIDWDRDHLLRLFACWCARWASRHVTGDTPAGPFGGLLDLAEGFATGKVPRAAMDHVYELQRTAAAAAATCGVLKGRPGGSVALACFSAAEPDARRAAVVAARHAVRAARDLVATDADVDVRGAEERLARASQAHQLRTVLGNPFRGVDRAPLLARRLHVNYWEQVDDPSAGPIALFVDSGTATSGGKESAGAETN